jgi:membrane protein DedA with SNARE-associated domain
MVDIFTQFVAWGVALASSWGYLGIFFISLIGNASIIFPIPSYLVIIAAGGVMNPWLLGIAGGLGAALGELVGYAIGRGGNLAVKGRYKKLLTRTKKWSEKHGLFPLIILFAATPLPDDIVGILSGVIKYDIKKFMAANIIGKIIAYTALGWAGYFGGQLLGGWNMLIIIILSFILMIVVFQFIQAETGDKKPVVLRDKSYRKDKKSKAKGNKKGKR